MRIIAILIAILTLQSGFAQVKHGTYTMSGDTKGFGGAILFSNLILKKDNTFTYQYRTTSGCLLWYDFDGKWAIKNDTLVLTDTLISYHSVMEFRGSEETAGNEICIFFKTKKDKPVPGVRVTCAFKNSKDTLSGVSDADGKFITDTRCQTPTKREHEWRSIDDVSLWVYYFNAKKGEEVHTNNFSDLSQDMQCTIDDDAANRSVFRTTLYKINGPDLTYLTQWYDQEDVRPWHWLFGNFTFKKE